MTALFFIPVLRGGFLHWDDESLLVDNPYFRGLGPSQWRWMCTTFLLGHWQPLSWLSYALDYKLWGMNPQGWHAANLLLHTLNAVLVYRLCLAFLKERTGRYCMVAALAALFWAIHPLRVEAVAWLATRGYLLCTTFCLLTVLFYLRAVEQKRYPFAALLCFVLATCMKGIGMMLPPVLLLVDWISFRRIRSVRTAMFCTLEKIPFFALSLLTGVTAFLAKQTHGGMAPVERYGWTERIDQAVYGIWFYLLKTISPQRLSPLYWKHPGIGYILVALVLTGAVAALFFLFRRQLRSGIAAISVFLLLVFPMLGFTQSGVQLFADRFTYLAAVPFSVLLAAGLNRWKIQWKPGFSALAILTLLFGAQTFTLSSSWNDDLTLWYRVISLSEENTLSLNGFGRALLDRNQFKQALERFDQVLHLDPGYVYARHNRALTLAQMGRTEEALAEWKTALSFPEGSGPSRFGMMLTRGWVCEQAGRFKEAEADYAAVADDPAVPSGVRARALRLRATLFIRTSRNDLALADLKEILQIPVPASELEVVQVALRELKKIPGE